MRFRPSLLRQVCPPIGLALLMAFGVLMLAVPVLAFRLVVAVWREGISWKEKP